MKKRTNKKAWFTFACFALAVLLTVSTYISVVVVGVIADEGKKSKLTKGEENSTETLTTVIESDNVEFITTPNNITNETDDVQAFVPQTQVNNEADVPFVPPVTQQLNPGDVESDVSFNPLLDTNKTKADIVKIYADVMNNAKAKAPGFKKVEYQELPDGPNDRIIYEGSEEAGDTAVNKMLNFVQDLGVFVPQEEAEANPYIHQKGDSDMSTFPVFNRPKGSYLTDSKGIESFTYKILPNGNVKMAFFLVPENNPEPIGENTDVAPSYTGAVFSPMAKSKIDRTVYHPIVTIFARDIKYTLRYHDCLVEVEFNPNTMEMTYLKHVARVSIKGSGDVVGAGKIGLERQELIGTVVITDFTY